MALFASVVSATVNDTANWWESAHSGSSGVTARVQGSVDWTADVTIKCPGAGPGVVKGAEGTFVLTQSAHVLTASTAVVMDISYDADIATGEPLNCTITFAANGGALVPSGTGSAIVAGTDGTVTFG